MAAQEEKTVIARCVSFSSSPLFLFRCLLTLPLRIASLLRRRFSFLNSLFGLLKLQSQNLNTGLCLCVCLRACFVCFQVEYTTYVVYVTQQYVLRCEQRDARLQSWYNRKLTKAGYLSFNSFKKFLKLCQAHLDMRYAFLSLCLVCHVLC